MTHLKHALILTIVLTTLVTEGMQTAFAKGGEDKPVIVQIDPDGNDVDINSLPAVRIDNSHNDVSVTNFPASQAVTGTVVVEDGGGSITVDGNVTAKIVAPLTGLDKVRAGGVDDDQKTITFDQNIMLRHVHFEVISNGESGNECLVSARQTSPSASTSFFSEYDFMGGSKFKNGQYSLGSGIEFQAGDELTVFTLATPNGFCSLTLTLFFDILD